MVVKNPEPRMISANKISGPKPPILYFIKSIKQVSIDCNWAPIERLVPMIKLRYA